VGTDTSGVRELADVPPRMVTVLLAHLTGGEEEVDGARDLLERLRQARRTDEWHRLPFSHRREWESALRKHRSLLSPILDRRDSEALRERIERLEGVFDADPYVYVAEYEALSEAADRLTALVRRLDQGPLTDPRTDTAFRRQHVHRRPAPKSAEHGPVTRAFAWAGKQPRMEPTSWAPSTTVWPRR
jgi:hypothetical protein